MDANTITVVATLSGTAIGALVTYAAAARQARASVATARVQFDAQLALAGRQFAAEQSSESRRSRQQRLETSYQELAAWLDTLDAAVEKVWDLVCSNAQGAYEQLRELCGDWPFTVLVPPKSAAFARCFWSAAVNELIKEFSQHSSGFVRSAGGARPEADGEEANVEPRRMQSQKMARQQSKTECWEGRGTLLGVTARIRAQIQTEIMNDHSGETTTQAPSHGSIDFDLAYARRETA